MAVAPPLVLCDGDRSRLEEIDLVQLGTGGTGASSRWWPCGSRGRSSFRASCGRSVPMRVTELATRVVATWLCYLPHSRAAYLDSHNTCQ
jgi:hypothetical protein